MNLLVIDGNSLLNRAFYGIKLLSTKDGQFTNAIFGFMNMLLNLKSECHPEAIAVAFDLKAPTFRHKLYSAYKAGRKGMPPELHAQLPIVKELLGYLDIKVLEYEGYEADDILGTLSAKSDKDNHCYVATGDRDSLQLISENTTVLLATTKMGSLRYTPETLKEEYGVTPKEMIEIKALMGDSSDNIPGVAGIGPKTAASLIQEYHSIENLYEKLPQIKMTENQRSKLNAGKESAFMSKELGTIALDVPIDTNYENYKPVHIHESEAVKLLARLEMFSTITKLGFELSASAEQTEASEPCSELEYLSCDSATLMKKLTDKGSAYFICSYENNQISAATFCTEDSILELQNSGSDFEQFMQTFTEDASIQKFTYDVKALYAYCMKAGYTLRNVKMDVMLAGYILNPASNDYTPLRLAGEYGLQIPKVNTDHVTAQNCAAMKTVSDFILKKLEDDSQTELFRDIELPLAEVLAAMETEGFMVDGSSIEQYGSDLENKISALTDEIYRQVGYEFNINSPKQLGAALFEKLGLPVKKKTKSGYSTNADVLESLVNVHPIISDIMDYRLLSKLKSTYCDGLLKVISDDGRIHSTLNQVETRTGRISSTEPNLQNIPVRTDIGKELRKFFIAKAGYVLIDADYSQIELRVLSHMADDEEMITAFNNDLDIHTITASQVFNIPEQMVTPLMRSRAKAVNFGIVYGIGAFSLAKDIGVTRKEADAYIKGYLAHYAGVNEYMHRMIEHAKTDGFAQTLFHRRRYLPELTSSNGMLRAFGERVAMNMPIQGTAADIIKIAMVKVYKRLKKENRKAKLILQVHDELIVECPEEEKEDVMGIVKEEMENACKMRVKLLADVHWGKTWYDAKG